LIFGYLLTDIFALFGVLWEDMYFFAAITEPFAALNRPEGADADQALLLNYTSSPRLVAMFDAAARGHWKVFRTAIYATLQRLLPIVVGGSITLWTDPQSRGNHAVIQFSTPLSVVVIIYLVAYLAIIPYEVFEAGYSRHLPGDCLTIADILSWTCCSSMLRKDTVDLNDDQLEAKLPASNPLDTRSDEPHNQKWYMGSRPRLAQQRFKMGLIRVSSRGDVYTVGIDTSTAAALYRPSKGLRRRIARIKEKDNCTVNPEATYTIAGVGKSSGLTAVSTSEKHVDVAHCQLEGVQV
jgi:hypothetical protein